MHESILTDRFGRRLGSIVVRQDGVQIARSRFGKYLGEYNPSSNLTRDRFGRQVGRGNFLAAQIHDNQE